MIGHSLDSRCLRDFCGKAQGIVKAPPSFRLPHKRNMMYMACFSMLLFLLEEATEEGPVLASFLEFPFRPPVSRVYFSPKGNPSPSVRPIEAPSNPNSPWPNPSAMRCASATAMPFAMASSALLGAFAPGNRSERWPWRWWMRMEGTGGRSTRLRPGMRARWTPHACKSCAWRAPSVLRALRKAPKASRTCHKATCRRTCTSRTPIARKRTVSSCARSVPSTACSSTPRSSCFCCTSSLEEEHVHSRQEGDEETDHVRFRSGTRQVE